MAALEMREKFETMLYSIWAFGLELIQQYLPCRLRITNPAADKIAMCFCTAHLLNGKASARSPTLCSFKATRS